MIAAKIRNTFTHIDEYWSEEDFKKSQSEWEKIQTRISNEKTNYRCGNCDTYWNTISIVNDQYNICPMCDTWNQPFLCNPINHESVSEYINPCYHKYLFPVNLDDDSNSYVLCRYNGGDLSTLQILSFSTIKTARDYIVDTFKGIDSEKFLEEYQDYLNGFHVKNGHNMFFSKDYVLSFEKDKINYELYRIDRNSKHALFIFVSELNYIGHVKGYETHKDAVEQMKLEYKERFDIDDIYESKDFMVGIDNNVFKYKDFIFGMIFECNY